MAGIMRLTSRGFTKKGERAPMKAIRKGHTTRRGRRPHVLIKSLRFQQRKRVQQAIGFCFEALMVEKGYIMTRTPKQLREARAAKKEAEALAAQSPEPEVKDEGPEMVARDAYVNKGARDVLAQVVRDLMKGKIVPGFTLLPKNKVNGNQTVEKVVLEDFELGHPARGMSLVSIKEKYLASK